MQHTLKQSTPAAPAVDPVALTDYDLSTLVGWLNTVYEAPTAIKKYLVSPVPDANHQKREAMKQAALHLRHVVECAMYISN